MSPVATKFRCDECNQLLDIDGNCTNVDCTAAHALATKDAARETAKATAGAAAFEPRAFTSSGRVD